MLNLSRVDEIEIPRGLVRPINNPDRIPIEINSISDYRASFYEDEKRIPEDLKKIWGLTYHEYLLAGYCKPNPERTLRHFEPFDLLQNTHVFLVRDEFGEIIGTKSLTLNSSETSPEYICGREFYFGMPLDSSFMDKIKPDEEKCRRKGTNIAASWRLMIPRKSHDLSVLSQLVEKTIEESFHLNISAIFCEVHPRHQLFYESIGFEEIARGEDSYLMVPAVLLRGYRGDIVNAWDNFKNGSRRERTKKVISRRRSNKELVPIA